MTLGLCRILDCIFDVQYDESNDEWVAIQVYRDGVPIHLDRFKTEDEAEACALLERDQQLQANGRLGVGA